MTGTPEHLAELSEAAASGRIAELYDDIRRVTGVHTVPLVHRALAAIPEALETVWLDLAPNLADPGVRDRAARLGKIPASAVAPLEPALVSVSLDAAAATLDAFARVNRLNVVGLTALLRGVDAPRSTTAADTAPDVIPDGLPMADLAVLPASTIVLLEEMSAPVAGGERPIVIPSLFRYFAHDERLLRALRKALQPALHGDILDRQVDALRGEAIVVVDALPYEVGRVPPGPALDVVERFLRTIPAMIVVGGLLQQALGLRDDS